MFKHILLLSILVNNRVIVIENRQNIFQLQIQLQLQQNRVINYNFVNYNYNFFKSGCKSKIFIIIVLQNEAPFGKVLFSLQHRFFELIYNKIIRQNTSKVGTKKPTKYIVNFRHRLYRKFSIYIYDKMHSKLEQKTLTKQLEISDLF